MDENNIYNNNPQQNDNSGSAGNNTVFPDPGYNDPQAGRNTYGGNGGQPSGGPEQGSGFAIASLVLGIVSIVLFCASINIVTGILGIIFGAIYLVKKYPEKRGMALAGLILSIISIALYVILLIIGIATGISAINSLDYYNTF